MGGWIDSHAHLDDPAFAGDLEAVLARAREAGVTGVVSVGTEPESWGRVAELAAGHPFVWAAMGLHPNEASRWGPETRALLASRLRDPRVVALGEIGLDFYRDHAPREAQERAFREQLELADSLGLPIAIHCREALDAVLALLDRHRPPPTPWAGVFHCFGGGADEAREVVGRGFHVSFTGPVTYKKADRAREAARAVPPDRLLVETDCPYLAPVPYRGKRNEPAFAALTGRALAALHSLDEAAFARLARENTLRLFPRLLAGFLDRSRVTPPARP